MGYSINDLRKADKLNGNDAIPIQSNGQTKQIEAGVMDQGTTITAGGSQNTGNIRREQLFILNNNSTQINLTIGNAVGRSVSNNEYQDSAAAATGWIIRIYNKSTRSHVIIYGANSWTITAGEMQEYFWTGSAWTYHHIVTSTELNNALANYQEYKMINISSGNANDCIPSNSDRVSYYRGTMSNTPFSNTTAVILTSKYYFVGSYHNVYQEVEQYGSSTVNYRPTKYIRYGYKGTSETEYSWSDWQKVTTESDLKHYHENSLNYGLKIKIMEKVSEKGNFFNAIFSWSSYGSGNYISLYLLRFSKTEITTKTRLHGTTTDTAKFTIENDDLYFYPNGDTTIYGGGGAYNLLLS